MSNIGTTDFSLEVAKLNIEGHRAYAVIMRNPSADNLVFTDLWGGGGDMVLPTAAESWEIVSSSADDTAAGTGARTVLISTLADTYAAQTPVTVTLNGTTAAPISGTHFRPNHISETSGAIVLTADPDETRTNIGDLTIRVAGGGATRMVIKSGVGKSEDGHMAVPLGFTAFLRQIIINWGKDQSGDVFGSFLPPGTDAARISSGELSLYQNDLLIPYTTPIRMEEKNELTYRAKPLNLGSNIVGVQEILLIDNNFI